MNLNKLKTIIQNIIPNFVVDFDEQHILNVKADSVEDSMACYIEEYRTGQYEEQFGLYRNDTLELYFFWTGDGEEHTAGLREDKREMLFEEGITPLLRSIRTSIPNISNVRYNIGPSRFDIYEIGVKVTLTIREEIC